MDEQRREPIHPRTSASFRVGGDRLDPDAVTGRLQLAPDLARAKGQRWSYEGKSKEYVQPTGVWTLDSGPLVSSPELEDHLVFLLNIVEPHAMALATVLDEYEAQADFYCVWQGESHSGLVISPNTLRRIAEIDATLGIAFVSLDIDD